MSSKAAGDLICGARRFATTVTAAAQKSSMGFQLESVSVP
jgi:hypothetical protein